MTVFLVQYLPQNREKRVFKSKERFGPTRFADLAIPAMIKELEEAVGKHCRKNFVAKMIGGAEIFGYSKLTLKIGEENT
ncbi:MAG: hypothetical protein ACFE9A_20370 [Candidatus Hodarchaeota archaeon]